MKFFFFLTVIFLFFTACGVQKSVVVQPKIVPKWYSNPTLSNEQTLYALGEGETRRMAINSALNEILATLSVSIESQFYSKKEVTRGVKESYQQTSSNEIISHVEKIKISNYEVVHEKDFGFERYLVLVKVDKQKLFKGLKFELDSTLQKIESKNLIANAIKRLAEYKKNKDSSAAMQNILSVMYALDSTFDTTMYIDKLKIMEQDYDTLLSQISFSIHSDTSSAHLNSSVAKALNAKGYKIVSTSGVNHFRIYITSTTSYANSYGFTLARSAINVTVKDSKAVVIGSNKLNLIGQSTQGKKIAKENVAIKLNAKIAKEGVSKVIGLDI